MFPVGSILLVVSELLLLAALTGCQHDQPTAPSPLTRRVALRDGLSVDYVDWGGRGDTLLFIPGKEGQTDYFGELAPHLTGRYRVLALCGSSLTSDESGDARMLCGFLDRLDIDRVHFVCPILSLPPLSRFANLFPQRSGTLFCIELDHERANLANSYYGFPSTYGNEMLRETRRAYWAAVADRFKRAGGEQDGELQS